MNPAEPSSGAKDHATELFAVVDSCWRRTVETLSRWADTARPPSLDAMAAEWVEEAVFLAACRRRGLLSDFSEESSRVAARAAAVKRFGVSLFQVYRDRQPGDSLPVDEDAISGLARFDIGPETLGVIHQRLLGLRATFDANGRPRFGRGKTVAKAGGIFYTPAWVARYMVDRAFECFDDGPSHDADKPARVLDPACGCGAFLLAAYRRLRGDSTPISKDGQAVHCTRVEQYVPGARRLGVSAVDPNRRAVLERLHGVDLDEQAVLTARRALWLATCDDPAGPLPPEESEVFFETIRPGNALTDPAFDRLSGTFDLVLGNPPYRRERGAKVLLDEIARTELGRRWRTARMDLWYYFVHRAVDLLADQGVLSLIVNSYWTAGSGAAKLVEHLRRETHVEEVFDLGGLAVFKQVAGRHMILLARKTRGGAAATTIKRPDAAPGASAEPFVTGAVPLILFKKTPDELFRDGRIDLEPVDRDLLDALGRGTPLGRLGRVRQGIAENPATVTRETNRRYGDQWTVGEGVFVLTPQEVESLGLSEGERRLLRPYHRPCEIGRYYLAEQPSRWLIHSTAETCPDVSDFPAIGRHLARFRPILEVRRETREGRRSWWQLHWPRDESLWTADKILSVQMARRPAFASATQPVQVNFSVNVFVPDASTREHLLYLTAMLNSQPLWRWFSRHAKRRGVGLEINGQVLARAPVRRIDFADADDRQMHDELVELARRMHRRTVLASEEDRRGEEACLDEIDRRIDQLACRLYGLPDVSPTTTDLRPAWVRPAVGPFPPDRPCR